ncbi:MAG: hypothetical protein ACYSO3_05170 [Planctomycetota bacterium]|jgi:hypothetical protein
MKPSIRKTHSDKFPVMRHSDINLTMFRYTHVFRGQETEAINALPDLEVQVDNTANYTRAE